MSQPPRQDPAPRRIKARWLLPIDGPPLEHGLLAHRQGRIVALSGYHAGQHVCRGDRSALEGGPSTDGGNVALLPGLVNAHTHLEFSDLALPLGRPGQPFPEWIAEVVAARQANPPSPGAVEQGCRESLACGVVLAGEIAQPGAVPAAVSGSPPALTGFLELLGFGADRRQQALQTAQAWVASATADHFCPGLSPHAPYSVHPRLLAECIRLAQQHQVTVAMHLAESPEELQLLASRQGGFRDFLEERGLWSSAEFLSGVEEYLEALDRSPRALVVHGNYLNSDQIAWLGQRRQRMSVVYCPRTHAYFAHPEYPLAEFLRAGATVALGTDSRASTPDLDLFADMQFVAARFPQLAPREILRLGTLAGAEALGRQQQFGSLTPGKRAWLLAVELPTDGTNDPESAILASSAVQRRPWRDDVDLCPPGSAGSVLD